MGLTAEKHVVPAAEVQAAGLETITNLIVRRNYGAGGKTIALNAHGDVVPPGEGWTHDPYGGEIADGNTGRIYGRAPRSASAISPPSPLPCARWKPCAPLKGNVELHFTYDEEFGGEVGPGWLLKKGHTKPDLMIAAGFSYQVVVAHNGCLQMEVTVHGDMATPPSPTAAPTRCRVPPTS
jgi:succinyl-diaminopimelate desuccinylase